MRISRIEVLGLLGENLDKFEKQLRLLKVAPEFFRSVGEIEGLEQLVYDMREDIEKWSKVIINREEE